MTTHQPDQVGRALRWAGIALLSCFAVLVLLLVAVAVQGLRLNGQVTALRTHLATAQSTLAGSGAATQAEEIRTAVATLQQDTGRMTDTTSSLPWRLASRLPGLSRSLTTVDELAHAADAVTSDVVPVVADIAVDLRNKPRRGPLDLTAVTSRRAPLETAQQTLAQTRERLADNLARRAPTNPVVQRADAEVRGELERLAGSLAPVVTVAQIGAGMTGEQGVRRYLVVLQSPAESRATGGLVGGYLQINVEDGGATVARSGSNQQLDQQSDTDVVSVNEGFDATWGPYGARRAWFASNLSLDFPSVATAWAGLYQAQYDVRLDGLIGVTPEAVGHLLSALGPLTLADGTRMDAGNAASLLEVELYRRYPRPADEPARDAFQLSVLRSLAATVLQAQPLSGAYVQAFQRAVGDGSIRMASQRPPEQEQIQGTALGGALPEDSRAFVAWSSQNIAGTKLDVYLHRSLRYSRFLLSAERERVVATAVVRNDAPTRGLPAYVTYRADLTPAQRAANRPGTNKLLVATYLTPGADVTSVLLDGRPVPHRTGQERGHPVIIVEVLLAPGGGTSRVQVTAEQAVVPGAVQTLRQPVPTPDDLVLE